MLFNEYLIPDKSRKSDNWLKHTDFIQNNDDTSFDNNHVNYNIWCLHWLKLKLSNILIYWKFSLEYKTRIMKDNFIKINIKKMVWCLIYGAKITQSLHKHIQSALNFTENCILINRYPVIWAMISPGWSKSVYLTKISFFLCM